MAPTHIGLAHCSSCALPQVPDATAAPPPLIVCSCAAFLLWQLLVLVVWDALYAGHATHMGAFKRRTNALQPLDVSLEPRQCVVV